MGGPSVAMRPPAGAPAAASPASAASLRLIANCSTEWCSMPRLANVALSRTTAPHSVSSWSAAAMPVASLKRAFKAATVSSGPMSTTTHFPVTRRTVTSMSAGPEGAGSGRPATAPLPCWSCPNLAVTHSKGCTMADLRFARSERRMPVSNHHPCINTRLPTPPETSVPHSKGVGPRYCHKSNEQTTARVRYCPLGHGS
jgi:hypothetical protein